MVTCYDFNSSTPRRPSPAGQTLLMMKEYSMHSIHGFLAALLLIATPWANAEPLPADLPPDFLPLGAYLSWERCEANAKVHNIARWDDVIIRLDALQANHVNLLWVTNMSEVDLPRLITECEKRGMRLLPSMGAVEAKVDWRWVDDASYYDKKLPQLVEASGTSESFLGWVLSDEPLAEHLTRVETLRQKFRTRRRPPYPSCVSISTLFSAPKTPTAPTPTIPASISFAARPPR